MTVYELTENQMNELRQNHYYEYGTNEYECAEKIPY